MPICSLTFMAKHCRAALSEGWRRRVFLLIFLTAVPFSTTTGFTAPTPATPDASPDFTYHSSVSEVRLVLFARDGHDRPVENLQKGDFAIVDDEQIIRDFRSFNNSTEAKLDVIVLLDSSESTLSQFQREVGQVRELITQWPWNSNDRVTVLSFGGMEPQVVCSQNCSASLLNADDATSVPHGGTTPLFDAIFAAAHKLMERRQPDVWPLIILFSDGNDTISKRSFREALENILSSGAQVYAVDAGNPKQPTSGTSTLQKLADDSGGRRFFLSQGAAAILHDVLNDLHSARVVTYALPASGGDFHTVRILPAHNLKLQFRCRSGYYRHSYGSR